MPGVHFGFNPTQILCVFRRLATSHHAKTLASLELPQAPLLWPFSRVTSTPLGKPQGRLVREVVAGRTSIGPEVNIFREQ